MGMGYHHGRGMSLGLLMVSVHAPSSVSASAYDEYQTRFAVHVTKARFVTQAFGVTVIFSNCHAATYFNPCSAMGSGVREAITGIIYLTKADPQAGMLEPTLFGCAVPAPSSIHQDRPTSHIPECWS